MSVRNVRSIRISFLFWLVMGLSPTAWMMAASFDAFAPEESFTYRVSFAIFGRAGEITIAAHEDVAPDGRALVRVTTDTGSRGVVRMFYAFDNHAEVIIERDSGRMLSVRESGGGPKKPTDSETIFDYAAGEARHVDRVRPERNATIKLPEGAPLDLITALVQTRRWNLEPGQSRRVLVHFGRELFPLIIEALGYEVVSTPLGKFRALMLVPRMDGEPKGLFKKGGQIKVWIAQDGSRLPVKMQLVLKYGTATLLMSERNPGKVGGNPSLAAD